MQKTAMSFGERVVEAVGRLGPLCAGIDPSADAPGRVGSDRRRQGTARVLPDLRRGVRRGRTGRSSHRSPSSNGTVRPAWPSSNGSWSTPPRPGCWSLADAKRGDIDTTAAAYADAWLGEGSPLAADAVTVHPYLGLAALAPLMQVAARTGRGVIVVATQLESRGEAHSGGGHPVGRLGRGVAPGRDRRVERARPRIPTGTVGAVIGATLARSAFPLSQLGGVILAPGLGAQGASPRDVADRFGGCAPGSVLASTSRALLAAGPETGRSPPGGGRSGRGIGGPSWAE